MTKEQNYRLGGVLLLPKNTSLHCQFIVVFNTVECKLHNITRPTSFRTNSTYASAVSYSSGNASRLLRSPENPFRQAEFPDPHPVAWEVACTCHLDSTDNMTVLSTSSESTCEKGTSFQMLCVLIFIHYLLLLVTV